MLFNITLVMWTYFILPPYLSNVWNVLVHKTIVTFLKKNDQNKHFESKRSIAEKEIRSESCITQGSTKQEHNCNTAIGATAWKPQPLSYTVRNSTGTIIPNSLNNSFTNPLCSSGAVFIFSFCSKVFFLVKIWRCLPIWLQTNSTETKQS